MSWDAEDDLPQPHEYSPTALRNDIDAVVAALHGLMPRVGGMDARLGEAEATVLRADRRVLEMEKTTGALTAQLKRLSARVEWLERNIRLRGEAEVQLDDVPAAVVRLARTAQEGREESDRLLGEARAPLEHTVEEHGAAVRALVTLRRAGLVECEVLAGTGWSDPDHRAAADRFSALMDEYREVRAQVGRLAGPALAAAHELAEDEERQLDGAGAIEAGEAAWTQLLAELRARLADAVGEGALLPEWFVAVLGPIPAAADTAEWMEIGTELLAYRVTHGIDDPIQALGKPPSHGDPHRLTWYHFLHRRLNLLDARR